LIFLATVLLLLKSGIIFGWAKPVPIDTRNLRYHRRDFALISLAGPTSNLIMAIIWAGIAKGAAVLLTLDIPGAFAMQMIGMAGISINIVLMVLNLLPIPQLDGGHILSSLLPRSIALHYERLTPYSFYIFLVLLALGVIDTVMRPITGFLFVLIGRLFNLPLQL
jgi:Zn-dependent protease